MYAKVITMNQQLTNISNQFIADLEVAIGLQSPDQIFVLVDTNSDKYCYPLVASCEKLKGSHKIVISSGDENKNIEAAVLVWKYLSENGANRKSLMINLGGGMITDLGGFVASTFKRGIRYINVSTTLLGAVDAATGGKTGINFMGLKNEIGVFSPADAVLIHTEFFKTLDIQNLRSGYAEMVKHALIDTRAEWDAVLSFDLETIDYDLLGELTARSVRIKEKVVEQDPKEMHIRKALNLGHTIGHAFETFSYRSGQPALHGYAVVWGLLCELYLSHIKLNFPKEDLIRLRQLIKTYYGSIQYDCKHYEELYELMTHDKKNDSGFINFTLLADVGDIHINQSASKDEIFEVLDFFSEQV